MSNARKLMLAAVTVGALGLTAPAAEANDSHVQFQVHLGIPLDLPFVLYSSAEYGHPHVYHAPRYYHPHRHGHHGYYGHHFGSHYQGCSGYRPGRHAQHIGGNDHGADRGDDDRDRQSGNRDGAREHRTQHAQRR